MNNILLLLIILTPFLSAGQEISNTQSIDSIIALIDKDPTLVKKVQDSASYQKEDGGNKWDSAYNHREIFYKDGQIVKIRAWNSYRNWRSDMLAYYKNEKPIRFSKGESFKGYPNYGQLDFQIYYFQDKDIQVTWLTPKPDNVLRVATDIFLRWAYSLLSGVR
jgi:hypothetical protein